MGNQAGTIDTSQPAPQPAPQPVNCPTCPICPICPICPVCPTCPSLPVYYYTIAVLFVCFLVVSVINLRKKCPVCVCDKDIGDSLSAIFSNVLVFAFFICLSYIGYDAFRIYKSTHWSIHTVTALIGSSPASSLLSQCHSRFMFCIAHANMIRVLRWFEFYPDTTGPFICCVAWFTIFSSCCISIWWLCVSSSVGFLWQSLVNKKYIWVPYGYCQWNSSWCPTTRTTTRPTTGQLPHLPNLSHLPYLSWLSYLSIVNHLLRRNSCGVLTFRHFFIQSDESLSQVCV